MKISTIRRIGIAPVYNMTVKEHHNFMVAGNVILHNCDALRYYCVSRQMPAVVEREREDSIFDGDDSAVEDYDSYLAGGEATQSYLSY